MSFLFLSARSRGTRPTRSNSSGARRRNRRSLRAAMLGRNVGSKSFIADWRINERSGARSHYCQTKGKERATLFLLVRFRRVPAAIVERGWHFHFRVATRLLDLQSRRLPRDRGHADRAGEDQAKQKAQGGSHRSQFTTCHRFRSTFGFRSCPLERTLVAQIKNPQHAAS